MSKVALTFLIVAYFFKKNVKNHFYITKGQKRGILLFILLIIVAILTRWGL